MWSIFRLFTDDISGLTKVILMILMFIGRVGLISFIIMIAGRKEPDKPLS